jgi:CII-binding regulator of phage lambda lysogenization HflD
LERDFYQDAERKQLLTILKAAMEQGDTSEFVEVLNDVVVLDKAIQANLSKMEELKNSIGELEKQYENTDRPNRLVLIHREIEKLKEQERCLTRAIFSENAQKKADIAKLLREVP